MHSPSVRCIPLPSSFCLSRSPLALRRLVGRRRPKPGAGAEAFAGLFAGDEHPPGTSTPSLLFPSLPFPSLMLCEAEHRNPNLKLFSYLTSLLTSKFLQKLLGVHVLTSIFCKTCWVYKCTTMPFTGSAPAFIVRLLGVRPSCCPPSRAFAAVRAQKIQLPKK